MKESSKRGRKTLVNREDVIEFIENYITKNLAFPTVTEIRDNFGTGSFNRFSDILKEVERSAIELKIASKDVRNFTLAEVRTLLSEANDRLDTIKRD